MSYSAYLNIEQYTNEETEPETALIDNGTILASDV
jgi:hypothetical protein